MPGLVRRLLSKIIPAGAALALAGCAVLGERDPLPHDYPIHGIDVSYYQGNIDWAQVKRSGTAFAFIKATEGGDHLDPMFQANWQAAKAAGVPRGAYHFYYFCRPVEDQIAWFKANVPVERDALPPVLDMEWNGHSKTCRTRPPRDKILADMRLFLAEMERHYGKRPVVYTAIDFHRDILVGHFPEHAFWLRSVRAHPKRRYDNRDWHFWQYTEKGQVAGIPGPVDRNVFAGNAEQWSRFIDPHGNS